MNRVFENALHDTPITVVICGLMAILGVLSSLEVVHPIYIILSPSLVLKEHQYLRLFANFFYVGPISAHCVMEIQWIHLISSHLEAQYFHRKPLDYLFLLFVTFSVLLGLRFTSVIDAPYLSYLLGTVLTYIMSRLFQDMQVAIFFVLPISMRLLPFAFMVLNSMVSGMTNEVIGNLIGHVLWYLLEVFPRITGYHPLSVQRLYDRVFTTQVLDAQ